jgi:hypothetical protein
MEAISRSWDLSVRRAVALFLGLVATAMLAGAVGGYLTKGTTTYVVTHPIVGPVLPTAQAMYGARTTAGYIPGL